MSEHLLGNQKMHGSPISVPAARGSERGFTLIEILIAVLVLSFGLLGLAMLQATGLKYNTDSYTRTQATLAAYGIMDRIRANRTGADQGYYVAYSDPGVNNCGDTSYPWPGCTDEQNLALYDLHQWYQLLQTTLPAATSASQITRSLDATGSGASLYVYTITVRWNEHGTDLAQSWELHVCQTANNC